MGGLVAEFRCGLCIVVYFGVDPILDDFVGFVGE